MNPNPTANPPPAATGRMARIAVVLIVIGLLVGFVPRWLSRRALASQTTAAERTVVSVILPQPTRPDLGTPLPAEVEAYIAAPIHARASGYLLNWRVDIGDQVTNGQVLAEIETPELAQQLEQARADLDQARAALALAKITADRWLELSKTASVSEQETADKTGDFAVKQAAVEAATANLNRLRQLKDYDLVTAPFAGTITRRNTDIGQLITADSGPELFDLAQLNPLRVYVQVPQPLIHVVRPGQVAELSFQELPGRTFQARVTRTAGAVDTASRTLQVELEADNAQGTILPGSFAQARFQVSLDASPVLVVDDTALIFRAQGMQLAVVGPDDRVALHDVRLGRDFGNTVEVLAGVTAQDRVINNPSDSIANGDLVTVAAPATNAAAP